jgi:OOP family OmpA-OmpF porin
MKRFAFALAVALGLVSVTAMAADPGFYAGVGIGQFNVEIDSVDLGDGSTSLGFDDDDTGFKIFGGYQFLPWLGAELGYVDGGTASESASDPDFGGAKLDVDVSAFTVAAVGTLPIGDMFELYGKLGMAFWQGDLTASITGALCDELVAIGESCSDSVDDDGEDFYYGLGAGFNIGESFNVRVEYEVFEIDPQDVDADANFLSLSGVYRF